MYIYYIIEKRKKGLIDFSRCMSKFFSVNAAISNNPMVESLKFRLQHNGEPLHLDDLEMMTLLMKERCTNMIS
jgi:hypothetical protein